MYIITNSIKDELEIQLNIDIKEITEEELLEIKTITLNRLGFDDSIKNVDYDEILYFKKLEELSIFSCMINEKLMNNITQLNNLKKLYIYDSDFVDYCNDFFDKLNLENLTINNCLGLSKVTLENLKYLELSNIKIDFNIKNVETLNIARTKDIFKNIYLYNVKNIIISKNNYNEYTTFDNFNSNITIVNERMEKIEEIKNDKI